MIIFDLMTEVLMESYTILKYPDNRLFKKSEDVKIEEFKSKELIETVKRMYHTMKINNGIGLAAPQVNIHKNIIVLSVENTKMTLINPNIVYKSNEMTPLVEGCLSIPNVSGGVNRPRDIEVHYNDEYGQRFSLKCTGLLAKCIQHEIDHLNGVLYINRMEGLKKRFLLKKYDKLNKWSGNEY
jgi:peptide deformylase